MQKRIGTLVPLWSLSSSKLSKKDNGTFAVGPIFLEWLKKTNQSSWQLLPLHATQLEEGSSTKHVPSPYKSYGIGLDPKYLPVSFVTHYPTKTEYARFIMKNQEWIHDYALFCALTDHFHTDDWRTWDEEVRNRDSKALLLWATKLEKRVSHHIRVQWQLHEAYSALRSEARKKSITLSGDVPFYLSVQSPLVWAHQSVFDLQKNGSMKFVSGVPETLMSHFGRQIWGHPLYNWDAEEEWGSIVSLWKLRLRYFAQLFDCIRFDYATGFFEYGILDLNNALHDGYRKGPGKRVFEELITFSTHCGLSVFVEDSGNFLIQLGESLKKLNVPGVKIFRFAFNEKKEKVNVHHADIAHYPARTVVYTTTHDTETLLGYLHNLTSVQKQLLAKISGTEYDATDTVFAKKLRSAILASPAQTVIIPIQDWLLTTDRINVPGTELPVNDPNWNFHLKIPIEQFPTDFR